MSRTAVDEPEPAVIDALDMRRAMGLFASGVTIVTGMDDEDPVGFACQSFASVSLDPPLVLICADHRGRSWPRIRTSGRFTINVLGEDQRDLCNRFGSASGTRFTELAWDRSRWNTPSLPGVLLRIHAAVDDVRPAGDHDVIIGRVLELESLRSCRPLLFYRGLFELPGSSSPASPQAWDGDWGWGSRWG
ncbi:flavin reductase family protein [Nocardioides sp. W7]|uniref:flavin reductase family protein n=1 Tax=Nocardioides sp. W7 TaxID=2931390 RepID=UPI001FD5591D|nr:flavin reductase family protein [Nocardioides sp. W7]